MAGLGRLGAALILLDVVCVAQAALCSGNFTREQCSAVGGTGNRCCFFFANKCQPDALVSVGSRCYQSADQASCDEEDCCTWASGAGCASDREKRGCKTGIEMCACHGYDQAACDAVGCCSFTDGSCSSAVAQQKCHPREEASVALASVEPAPSASSSLAWIGWTVAASVVVIAGAVIAKLVRRRRLGEKSRSHDGRKLASHDGVAIAQIVDSE
jgi:hypothetical protein